MGFWGIEVKPGKPYPYRADNVQRKLHVTQATLGIGSSTQKSILQCSSGHKSPVFLCSLLPNKIDSCPLNLEFDDEDLVAFLVIGPRSIHLSGYFVAADGDGLRDDYEYDSLGEDVGADSSEEEESSEYDSEDGYAGHLLDDSDTDMYPSSPVPNGGDDDQPENGDYRTKQLKEKEQSAHLKEKYSKSSQLPVVIRGESSLLDLDEDGFSSSTAEKGKSESQQAESETKREQEQKKTGKANKKAKDADHSASLKRKVGHADEDEQLQDGKKKKKIKLNEHGKVENANASGNSNETNVTTPGNRHSEEVKATDSQNNVSHAMDGHDKKLSNNEVLVEGNKTTFPNGLVIEELSMGQPDGKRAAPGKKVSVRYSRKLKKEGKIFDSTAGRRLSEFRLGEGQVIDGWEAGIDGMKIGDIRRITIPPSMGYGDKRVGDIPPNSWFVFDVELVDVGR